MRNVNDKRGFVLTVAMITAVLIAMACMALLAMATNEAQRARFQHVRTRARYASEAGLAWAQEQLRANGCWDSGGAFAAQLPITIDGVAYQVAIDMPACPGCAAPGSCAGAARQMRTRVTY